MDSDFRARRGRLRGFSINRLIPNVLTLAALCAGLTAIRYGLQGQMERAVIAIMVAAVLDALDGRVARRLGVTSRFGAELEFALRLPLLRRRAGPCPLLSSLTERGSLGWVVAAMFPSARRCATLGFDTALVSDTPHPPGPAAISPACQRGRRPAGADSADGGFDARGGVAAPSRSSSARCWCCRRPDGESPTDLSFRRAGCRAISCCGTARRPAAVMGVVARSRRSGCRLLGLVYVSLIP